MKDVARLAGVSTSTVSHVINRNRYVSDEIQAKVHTAIEQLNYAPSALARSLKVKQTKIIGMLVTASNNPFFSELVRGVEQSCYEKGYNLILCNTEGNINQMDSNLNTLLEKRVDGLLLMCTENRSPSADILRRYPDVPMVVMDWAPITEACDVIQDNSFLGGEMATQYLVKRGYRKIACIAGPQDRNPAQERLLGFRQVMTQSSLVVLDDYIIFSDFDFAGGYQSMKKLLALTIVPEAVFIQNDVMAVGAYLAIYEAGLSIPKDIAIIGYDNIEFAQYMTPPLTTIRQPKNSLGRLAINTLIKRMENPGDPPQILTLKPELIERKSVCNLRR